MIECSGPNPVPIQFISLGTTAISCMTLDIYDEVSEDIVVWSVNFDLYTMGHSPVLLCNTLWLICNDSWVYSQIHGWIFPDIKINLTQFALWHNHEVRTIDACINSMFRHLCLHECERRSYKNLALALSQSGIIMREEICKEHFYRLYCSPRSKYQSLRHPIVVCY